MYKLSIIGPTSIIIVHGDYWKKLRKMFNLAFAYSHLETLVPKIIEESLVFVDILNKAAQMGEILPFGQHIPVNAPITND